MSNLNIDELKKDYEWLTIHLSNRVRAVSYGIIVALWALLTSEKISLVGTTFNISAEWWIRLTFSLTIIVLLIDFLQYVVSYKLTHKSLLSHEKKVDEGGEDDFQYEDSDSIYKLTFVFFWIKLVAIVVVVFFFLFTLHTIKLGV